MPILAPVVGIPPATGASGTGTGGGGPPPPVAGSKIPPLADSAVVYEYSYSTGTGPYTLAGPYGSWKGFVDAYNDGDTVYYRATDGSARTEYVVGTFSTSAGSLSRDLILGSTNGGAAISWAGRTRVLVHALVEGLPLCTTPPQDGQVPTWDAQEGLYCPKDIPAAPASADDDTCDMQDFDSGTDFTITLTKPTTQAVCRSTDAGVKTWTIPDPALYNGYSLDIKLETNDGSTHHIVTTANTVGGHPGITVIDEDCNLSLRAKAADNDWIIRCYCCPDAAITPYTPAGPPRKTLPVWIATLASNPFEENIYNPGITHPTNTLQTNITLATPVQTVYTPQVLIAVMANGIGMALGGLTTPGLVWQPRVAYGGIEVWWADIRSLSKGQTVSVSVDLGGSAFTPAMSLYELTGPVLWTGGSPWDTNAALPIKTSGSSGNTWTASGFSTDSVNSLPLAFLASPETMGDYYGGPGDGGNNADVIPWESPGGFIGQNIYPTGGPTWSLSEANRQPYWNPPFFDTPVDPPGAYTGLTVRPFVSSQLAGNLSPWVMIVDAIAGQ